MAIVNSTFFAPRNVMLILAFALIGHVLFAKARSALDGMGASDAN